MIKAILYSLIIPLAGCSLLQTGPDQSTFARADHADQYCKSQGYHYPQSGYAGCRLQLANQTRERQYQQLQILDQGSQPTNNVPAPTRTNYTPLSANNFKCRRVVKNKHEYILCTEQSG